MMSCLSILLCVCLPLPAGMHYFCLKTREILAPGFPRPPTFQEVMSGSRLTPWTEDSPRLRCLGLALTTWKCGDSSRGRKFWLHVPTVMLQVYLLALGTDDFASRQMRLSGRVGLPPWREGKRQPEYDASLACHSNERLSILFRRYTWIVQLFVYLFRPIFTNVWRFC
jgi:hypothetical protein